MNRGIYIENVISHYKTNWGDECTSLQWRKGPTHKHPPNFRVLEYPPNKIHNMWAYGTVGMSCEKHEHAVELHMFSPYQTERIVELLTIVACFHYNDESLGLNHRINFGEPWLEKSECTRGFISLVLLETDIGNIVQTKNALAFGSVIISGVRVKLVPISLEYSEVIFKEFTDEITRYMIPATPATLEEIHAFIQSSMRKMDENTDLTLAILNKHDDEFLGVCGLHGALNPDEPILGIWLKKSAHGYKYGQEAIKALADWARQNIIFDYMLYPCDKDNIPSRKIAESLNGAIFRTGELKSMSGRILNEIAYKIV